MAYWHIPYQESLILKPAGCGVLAATSSWADSCCRAMISSMVVCVMTRSRAVRVPGANLSIR